MMEKNTDRLFWTLTSIIVGALLLTISVKAFPGVANSIVKPISGITKQADTSTKTSDQAYKDAIGGVNSGSNSSSSSNNNSSSNNGNSQSSQPTDPDAQAKANAVEASTLNLKVTSNNDGTGILAGPAQGHLSGTLNIPEYVKVNGQLVKITGIGNSAFYYNNLTSVTIPDSVTTIGTNAFYYNFLTSVTLGNNVTDIGYNAFNSNQLTSINIPNSVKTIKDNAFNSNKLTSVNIPNSVTSIGDFAFVRNNITSVNIGSNVTSIGYQAFQLNQIKSANVPNQQGYQSVQSNGSFDSSTTVTNNPSN